VDAIDPRTGLPIHEEFSVSSVERYSETAWSQLLLGYNLQEDGVCPLLRHPRFGTACYPVTFFTNAPLPVICSGLNTLSITIPVSNPLLEIKNVTISNLDGTCAVDRLTLSMLPGDIVQLKVGGLFNGFDQQHLCH
jgi:hypothetical protein